MIKIKNLKKFYDLEGQTIKALNGISTEIKSGELVVIVGQSGCGKSTLLNIVGGLDRPSSGEVCVNSENISQLNRNKQTKYRREVVGMIFQKFNLINDMTVLDNVMLPLKFCGLSETKQKRKALEILKRVGLGNRVKSIPNKLSGGQQQRVAIARALINNPEILLCDEPTGNLDSKTGQEILNLLKELNRQGMTVIIITHNPDFKRSADHIIEMLDGKIINEEHKNQKSGQKIFSRTVTSNITLFSLLKIAKNNISRRKLRVFLTSFGVAIGAMAVVILVSFGAGLQKDVGEQINSFTQVEEIQILDTKANQDVNFSMGPSFEKEEALPLNDSVISKISSISHVDSVYPEISFNAEANIGDKIGRFWGSNSRPIKYVEQKTKDDVEFGSYFEKDDEDSVIIPAGLATELGFENKQEIIGKKIAISNFINYGSNIVFKQLTVNLTVVGVLSPDSSLSYQAVIPVNKAISINNQLISDELLKQNPKQYNSLTARASDTAYVGEIKKSIEDLGYGTQSYEDIAKQFTRIFSIMQLVLGVIGSIALLVASLGIINTMLMAILERTKEIGVMKAIGARQKDIQAIFLIEALLIGLFGGLAGLALGYLGTNLLESIANSYLLKQNPDSSGLNFYIPLYLSLGIIIFSTAISSLAGFLPSRRAAKLDPVAALRDE